MAASTAGFAEELKPGLREIIGTSFDGRESYYTSLMSVETTDRNYEEYLAATGLPVAVDKAELAPIQSFDPKEGSKVTVTPSVSGIGFEVSEEAWEDDLYQGRGSAIRAAGSGLADSLIEKVELEAHSLYSSDAFDGTITVLPNSQALYATAHTPVTGAMGPNQSNRAATDAALTMTSYRAMLTQFRKYKNDQGLRIPGFTRPEKLVVGPDLEWVAMEIVGNPWRINDEYDYTDATQEGTVAKSDVANVSKGKTSVMVDPYITSATEWYGIAPKNWLKFLWRWRPRMDAFDDRRARAAIFVGYQRFAVAAVHWLGTYASEGDGA